MKRSIVIWDGYFVKVNKIVMMNIELLEQDNSPPDNCSPQIFFSFIFSFWLLLSYSMNSIALQNTLQFKPVLSLYLVWNHFFSKFFLIINLCT